MLARLRLVGKHRRLPLGAALLSVLGAVALGIGMRSAPDVVIDVERLGDRSLDAVACDDAVIWLRGHSRTHVARVRTLGLTRAFASQRATVVRVSRTGEIVEADMGEGLVAAFSEARDGSLWTVLLDLATDRTRTVVSTDGGRSWAEAGAPADVIGVAFASRQSGYAWSTTRVYRTDDGGSSWRSQSLLPYRRERGGGMATARLGTHGELWIPLDRTGADATLPEAKLVVLKPDLSFVDVAAWATDRVLEVAPDGAGAALVAVSPTEGGHRVERVALRPGTPEGPTVVRPWRRAALLALQSRGSSFLLQRVTVSLKAGVLSNLPATLETSRDGGTTWTSHDVTDEAAGEACLAESGSWTVSRRYRRVVFHALPC